MPIFGFIMYLVNEEYVDVRFRQISFAACMCNLTVFWVGDQLTTYSRVLSHTKSTEIWFHLLTKSCTALYCDVHAVLFLVGITHNCYCLCNAWSFNT